MTVAGGDEGSKATITRGHVRALVDAAGKRRRRAVLHDVSFVGATLEDGVSFENVIFAGDASFRNATFAGTANFVNATFESDADFRGATFKGVARFERATFTRQADFANATFGDKPAPRPSDAPCVARATLVSGSKKGELRADHDGVGNVRFDHARF